MNLKEQLIEQSKHLTLDQRIKLCAEKAAVGDSVLVYKLGGVIKRGKIVKLTTAGANIFNPDYRRDQEFDSVDGAEWFPFKNKVDGVAGGMVLV